MHPSVQWFLMYYTHGPYQLKIGGWRYFHTISAKICSPPNIVPHLRNSATILFYMCRNKTDDLEKLLIGCDIQKSATKRGCNVNHLLCRLSTRFLHTQSHTIWSIVVSCYPRMKTNVHWPRPLPGSYEYDGPTMKYLSGVGLSSTKTHVQQYYCLIWYVVLVATPQWLQNSHCVKTENLIFHHGQTLHKKTGIKKLWWSNKFIMVGYRLKRAFKLPSIVRFGAIFKKLHNIHTIGGW